MPACRDSNEDLKGILKMVSAYMDDETVYAMSAPKLCEYIREILDLRKQIHNQKEHINILKDAYQCAKDRAKDKF